MKIYRNGEFVIGRIRIIESDIDGMVKVGWNKNNSDRLLPLDLEQPDYTQLSV